MSTPAVVLDSGVIDRATTDREFRLTLRDLIEGGWDVVIPTVTLAEVVTGRPQDAPANQAIRAIGTVDTTQATARRAGQLRFAAQQLGGRRPAGGIDAIVAAHAADAEAGVVFTTDAPDLRRLLADLPRILVQRP
jgi:predicted nucleic acid-binding protein